MGSLVKSISASNLTMPVQNKLFGYHKIFIKPQGLSVCVMGGGGAYLILGLLEGSLLESRA